MTDDERNAAVELIAAQKRDIDTAVALLADIVVKSTDFGQDADGFITHYVMPTGPMHRAIPWLQNHGVTVRPGFDGRVPRPNTG